MVIRAAEAMAEAAESFHSFPTDRARLGLLGHEVAALSLSYRSGEAENVQLSDMSYQSADIFRIF